MSLRMSQEQIKEKRKKKPLRKKSYVRSNGRRG